jgi:hypothetical protein
MKTGPKLARFVTPPLFRTARKRCLTPWGIQLIIQRCEFLHEGQTVTEDGKSHYFGSTMITLKAQDNGRELCDKKLDEILCHIRSSPVINVRLARLARLEATRRIGAPALGTALLTYSARRSGKAIEITLDVEIPGVEQGAQTHGSRGL